MSNAPVRRPDKLGILEQLFFSVAILLGNIILFIFVVAVWDL